MSLSIEELQLQIQISQTLCTAPGEVASSAMGLKLEVFGLLLTTSTKINVKPAINLLCTEPRARIKMKQVLGSASHIFDYSNSSTGVHVWIHVG